MGPCIRTCKMTCPDLCLALLIEKDGMRKGIENGRQVWTLAVRSALKGAVPKQIQLAAWQILCRQCILFS